MKSGNKHCRLFVLLLNENMVVAYDKYLNENRLKKVRRNDAIDIPRASSPVIFSRRIEPVNVDLNAGLNANLSVKRMGIYLRRDSVPSRQRIDQVNLLTSPTA